MLGQHENKCLAVPIYGAIKIAPFAADFHIGLIETPRRCRWHLSFLRKFGQSGCVFHDPMVERHMVDPYTTLRQNFFEISIRDGVADVEKTACRITFRGNCAPLNDTMTSTSADFDVPA